MRERPKSSWHIIFLMYLRCKRYAGSASRCITLMYAPISGCEGNEGESEHCPARMDVRSVAEFLYVRGNFTMKQSAYNHCERLQYWADALLVKELSATVFIQCDIRTEVFL